MCDSGAPRASRLTPRAHRQPIAGNTRAGQTAGDMMNQTIFDRIASEMTQIFALSADALDPKVNLFELGLDSLMLLKLGQRLEGIYGVTVEMGYFFRELNTLEKIVAFVEKNSAGEKSAAPESSSAPSHATNDAPAAANATTRARTSQAEPVRSEQRATDPAALAGLNGLFAQQIDTMLAVFRQQMAALIPGGATAAPALSAPSAVPMPTLTGMGDAGNARPATAPAAGTGKVVLTAEEQETIRSIQRNVRGLKLEADTFSPEQEAFVRGLLQRHVARTRKSREMMRDCRDVLADWKSTLSFRLSLKDAAYPIISAGSANGHIRDVDGNDLIDIALGMGVHFPGHRNPVILEAVRRQMEEGYELGPQCDLTGRAARGVSRLTGCARVAFSNTGSEAVMMALRLARAHTGRKTIVMFSGSYHGIFDGVVAMRHGEEDAVALSPGTPQGMVEDLKILDYGTDESLRRIEALAAAGNLAAVLVEPVQSRRPSLQPQTYLRKLRRLTREHGVVLIFDEMVTGFRIAPGGAQAHFGIRADLAVYGKIIGGGMPIGVVAGQAAILDHIDGGAWDYGDGSVPGAEMIVFGGTFCRHPLAMASVCAVAEWFEENGTALHDRANERTEALADRLNLWFQQEQVPLRMSWFGSQFKFDTYGRYSPLLQPVELDLLYLLMLEQGVYTWERRTCFLSAQHTDEDVAAIERAVRASVLALRAGGFEFKGGGPALFRPLASVERRLLAEMERGGRQDAYHMPGAWIVEGALEAERLEIAFGTVIKRHDSLRTSYRMVNGEYVARVDEEPAFFLERIDGAGRTPEQMVRDFQRPFELARAPLLRAGLATLDNGRSLLLIDGLHLVLDGISLATLVQDLQAAHEDRPLSAQPASYAEYVTAMQAYAGSQEEAHLLEAWQTYLADAPEPVIPADFATGADGVTQEQAGHVRLEVDAAQTAALRELGKAAGASLFMLLSGGYAKLLHTISGQRDIVLSTVAAGRPGSRFSETVGMFVNTLALRLRPEPERSVRQYLASVREACTFAYGHQELPFETLAAQGLGQLVRTMITYENADGRELHLAGCAMRQVTADIAGAMFPLSLDVIETGGVLHLDFEFDPGVLERATVVRWAGWLRNILAGFVRDPEQPLETLRPFAEAEAEMTLRFGRGTQTDIPTHNLAQAFLEQTALSPERTAVVAPDGEFSFRALAAAAARIADVLRAETPCPRRPVAICLERSRLFPAAVFGVLQAGGHYIPLAPDTPPARARAILHAAGAAALLTSRALAAQCADWGAPLLEVDTILADAVSDTNASEIAQTSPDDPAYILFTSGSTGTPKGVVIPQRAVLNLAGWLRREIYAPLGGAIQEGMLAHFVFDVSVQHLFGALLCGNTLHILAEHLAADGPSLRRYAQERQLDLLDMTPSQFLILSAGGEQAEFSPVRHLNFGAEALPRPVVQAFFRNPRNRGVRVCNMYGPTETCVQSTWAEVTSAAADDPRALPIGRPIDNTVAYVLDDRGRPLPAGLFGDLWIGGAGLALGYLGDPAQTAAAFVETAFGRLYKTGDRARWRADGQLEFAGRSDAQLKILGHRIEPGEIEEVALRLPGLRQAAVVAAGAEPRRFLALYYAPQVDGAALRRHLEQALPPYMIPAQRIGLDALPLTPGGKIDRRALPAPQGLSPRQSAGARRTLSAAEEQMLGIWQSVLQQDAIDPDEHFLEAGGDSVKALQIVARLLEAGYRVSVADLFRLGSIAALAAHTGQAHESAPREAFHGSLPLSPMQAWFFSPEARLPRREHYNHALLFATESIQPNAAKQAALACWKAHDALRATFQLPQDGEAIQTIRPPLELDGVFLSLDLRAATGATGAAGKPGATEAADLAGITEQITHDATRRQTEFDLAAGPLFRVIQYRTDAGDRLLFLAHHLVVDALTWPAVLEDFLRALSQARAGQRPHLRPAEIGFTEWVQQVHAAIAEHSLTIDPTYWVERLQQIDTLLPNATTSATMAAQPVRVQRVLTQWSPEALSRLPKQACGATPAEALLTALTRTLACLCPGKRAGVLMEGHGRRCRQTGEEALGAAGWFTAVWPVLLPPLPALSSAPAQTASPDEPASAAVALAQTGEAHVAGAVTASAELLVQSLLAVKQACREAAQHGDDYAVLRYLGGEQSAMLRALPEPEIVFNYLGDLTPAGGFFRTAPEEVGAETSGQAAALELDLFFRDGELHLCASVRDASDTKTVDFACALLDGMTRELSPLLLACAQQTSPLRSAADFTGAPLTQAEFLALCAEQGWTAAEVEDIYPLTPAQEGMLFHLRQNPQTPAYFEQLWFDLEGEMNLEAFEGAWREVSRRHSALRTVFFDSPRGEPLQAVLRELPPEFRVVDLPGADANALHNLYAQDRARAFDFARGPLVRCTLIRRGPGAFTFLHSYPHLIADGWCMGLMLAEFISLYRARLAGDATTLAPAPAYASFVEAVLHKQAGALRAWRNHLEGFAGRTGIARIAARPGKRMNEHAFTLPAQLARTLGDTARRWSVTPSTVFETAWALLLSEHAVSDDVAFGLVVSGRMGGGRNIESLVGLCIQTIPLRARIDRTAAASALARQLQQNRLELEPLAHVPLPHVSPLPAAELFDHILVFENYPLDAALRDALQPAGLQICNPGGHEEVEYDLSIEVHPGADYRVIFHFNENAYEPALFPALQEQLVAIFAQFAADANITCASVSLPAAPLPASPRASTAAGLTAHAHATDDHAADTVPARFLRRARELPDAPALAASSGGQQTRGGVARDAERIALALRERGVQPGEPVAMLLERGAQTVAAILGIWMARGVYVPLSPEAPAEHLQGILEQLQHPLLLTTRALCDERGLDGTRILDAGALPQAVSAANGANALTPVCPEDTAYIIFTSGSTGKPKGVRVGHRALANLAGWAARTMYAPGRQQRETWVPPIQFDASLHSLIGALTGGHVLLIPDDDTRSDPALLLEFMRRQRSDIVNVTPTFASALLDALGSQPWPGDTVILGAESISPALLARFYAHPQNAHLTIFNLYGPTEACVEVACHRMSGADWDRQVPVPIGLPVDGARLRILDRNGRDAPIGVPGELILFGDCLADGYHNRPEETARAFIPSPFESDRPRPERAYRTGDRARRLPSGAVVFAGRLDRQLKLRGHRIEPGEIEQRLLRQPGITGAAVLALTPNETTNADEARLIAFITGHGVAAHTAAQNEAGNGAHNPLHALRRELPPYMIPDRLIPLAVFPQNASGKLDDKALTALYRQQMRAAIPAASASAFLPTAGTEAALAQLWQEVLGEPPAAHAQSFFDAGGNSLAAMRLCGRIKATLGRELKLRALYESPEFGQLAALLDAPSDSGQPGNDAPTAEAPIAQTHASTQTGNAAATAAQNDADELSEEEKALLGLL